MGRIVLLVALGFLAVHCSNSHRDYSRTPAPRTTADLGFIVTATPAEIGDIEKNEPQAGIRTLSEDDGLYEVNHISAASLSARLTNKDLQKNFFMQASDIKARELSLEHLAANTSDDALDLLNNCRRTGSGPAVAIDTKKSLLKPQITLGEPISIFAAVSPNKLVGGGARLLWDILPPTFSKQGFAKGIADSQSFTPDSVGLYQIAVIGQGDDSSCTVQVIDVMVTANPALSDPPALAQQPDAALFKHLDEIHAREAWAKSRGDGVLVAVLDSGVNYNHPALRDRIAIKTAEEEKNDGNGLKGDVMGWDFVNGDSLPFDDEGHGTHVAGLIASSLAGVAPGAKILPVKVLDAAGSSDLGTVVQGIIYAAKNGAKIINMSLGFEVSSAPPPLTLALNIAHSKGVAVFVAAGNGDDETGIGYDIGQRPFEPAAIQLDNMVAVAATAEGKITSYSNFSNTLVALAAPGGDDNEQIVSLATMNPQNEILNSEEGTSMATPIVSGVAALLLSANPSLTPQQVRAILIGTGDDVASLSGKTVSGKQVNALQAVEKALDQNPVLGQN